MSTIISFDSIKDVRLLIDNGESEHCYNLSGALLGGIIAGGIGAIIGAGMRDKSIITITSVTVSVLTSDLSHPNIDIIITSKPVSYGTTEYQKVDMISRRIYNMFEIITRN